MKTQSETNESDFSDFKENPKQLATMIIRMLQKLEMKGAENHCSTLSRSFGETLDDIEHNTTSWKTDDIVNAFIDAVAKERLYFDPTTTWYHMLTDPTNISKIASILGTLINENIVSAEVSKIGTELHKRLSRMLLEIIGMENMPRAVALSTTGGSEANMLAMKLAVYEITRKQLHINLREVGVQGCPKTLKILVPDTKHYSFEAIAQSLGIGLNNLVKIKTKNFSASAQDVSTALEMLGPNDIAVGIVSVFGATETGACDDIPEIAKVIKEYQKTHDIWWHIDAAYGGPFLLLDAFKEHREAMTVADSVTIDAHKHLWTPFGAGFLCVKDAITFRNISTDSPYIGTCTTGISDETYIETFSDHRGGVTITGSMASSGLLSTYLTLITMSKDTIKTALLQTIATTKLLSKRLMENESQEPPIIVTSKQTLNLLTFKPTTGSLTRDNELVRKIRAELASDGKNGVLVSETNLNKGKDGDPILVNRIAIMSPLADSNDVDAFVKIYKSALHKVFTS